MKPRSHDEVRRQQPASSEDPAAPDDVDPRAVGSTKSLVAAPTVATSTKAVAAEYVVALSADEVLAQLEQQPDMHWSVRHERRELADVVTRRAFVGMPRGRSGFSVYATRPNAIAGIGAGFLRRLQLQVELIPGEEGTRVVCCFTHARSVQSMLRWAGLLATSLVGLAWVLLGGAELGRRALLLAAFGVFTLPVFVYDLVRYFGVDTERAALLQLIERALGPAMIEDAPGDKLPFRRAPMLPPREPL